LWCIGDGPMDHLVGRDRAFAGRFHQERRVRVPVAAVFQLMREYLDSLDAGGRGWWADDFASTGERSSRRARRRTSEPKNT
jgi:hypothetical protein